MCTNSKSSGGIGVHISDIRATGSYIKGTNGISNGIVPMLKVYNNTAKYVDQGGGFRKGGVRVLPGTLACRFVSIPRFKKRYRVRPGTGSRSILRNVDARFILETFK